MIMKNFIKTILAVFVTLAVTSCDMDDDNLGVDLENLKVPSNLGAVFQITQDNTGLVTITPTGDGANLYSVDFGDESPSSDKMRIGEQVEHVYAEGTYDVVVTGQNLAGQSAQGTQELVVSFLPPENLEVIITKGEDGYSVSISASADKAAMFEVYYGDVENEEVTPLMIGGIVTHTYTEIGTYNIRVVALSGGEATVEFSESVEITGPTEPMSLPITFDVHSIQYVPQEEGAIFNGASFEVVPVSDVNAMKTDTDKMGALTNSGSNWEGITFSLDPPADFSTANKTVTMKMYSEVAVPVLLKFEGGVNGERQNEVTVTHSGTGWEDLSSDFNNATKSYIDGSQGVGDPFVPTGEYSKMTIFVDGPGNTAGTFYFDDVNLLMEVLPNPSLPVSFDMDGIQYVPTADGAIFGGAGFDVVTNPDQSGPNAAATEVGAITNAGNNWEGVTFTVDEPIDFSSENKTIVMKMWSDVATPVLLKIEGGVNGDRQNEVTANHGGTGWEVLTFNYSTDATASWVPEDDGLIGSAFVPTGQYSQYTIFVDGPGTTAGTFYIDDIAWENTFPVTFDYSNIDYIPSADGAIFGGASFTVVGNPDISGANTGGSKVGALTNSGSNWEGITFTLYPAIDFSSVNKTVTMKMWSDVATPVLLKMEGGVNGERQNEVSANHGGTGWEVLTFNYSIDATASWVPSDDGLIGTAFVPTGQYSNMTIFVDGPGTTAGSFYFDDIQFAN